MEAKSWLDTAWFDEANAKYTCTVSCHVAIIYSVENRMHRTKFAFESEIYRQAIWGPCHASIISDTCASVSAVGCDVM